MRDVIISGDSTMCGGGTGIEEPAHPQLLLNPNHVYICCSLLFG